MAIGSWDPDAAEAARSINIDPQQLQRFIGWSAADQLDQLESLLTLNEQQALAGLMQLETTQWLNAAESLSDDDLQHLVRFFTVAENLPGWEAGERSPVIPLAKTLRRRGHKLDRELLLWIRSVNDNRFLPYGPL
jgi:hypothetical protein